MDYKTRMYDSYLNRWIQPDTIIPDQNNSQDWNRYSYVNNDPINQNDPTGHCILGTNPADISGSMASCFRAIITTMDLYKNGVRNPLKLTAAATGLTNLVTDLQNGINFENANMAIATSKDSSISSGEKWRARVIVGVSALVISAVIVTSVLGFPEEGEATAGTSSEASSYLNKINLQKQFASEAQMSENGIPIAGNGTKTILRDSGRLANTYGGQPENWTKMVSTDYTTEEGFNFQTHWYQNMENGLQVEFKTMFAKINGIAIYK